MVLTHNVYSSVVLHQVYQNQELALTNGLHFLSLSHYQPKIKNTIVRLVITYGRWLYIKIINHTFL